MKDDQPKPSVASPRFGRLQSPHLEGLEPESGGSVFDLASSIRRIEEYLIEIKSDDERVIELGNALCGSSFYLWLKETYRRISLRSNFFNRDYFGGEPAWSILIDLAISQLDGKRISVTSACIASGVSTTTALRWISVLVDDGMVIREHDISDRRRTFVRISELAMAKLNKYYKYIHYHPDKIPRMPRLCG